MMDDVESKGVESAPKGVAIPVRWNFSTSIPTIYANQMLITHASGEFYLIFGEVQPPLIIDPSKEAIPEFIEITPVAKIVISPNNMPQFLKALNFNFEKYTKHFSEDKEE